MDKHLLENRLAMLTQAQTVAEREGDVERVAQLQLQIELVRQQLTEE